MLVFPNCKINIGLNIVSRRSDGYHDLETIFYPVRKLSDAVEIIPQPVLNAKTSIEAIPNLDHSKLLNEKQIFYETSSVQFLSSGIPIEGNTESNLSLKAYHLLKKDFPQLPAVSICLHKAIPMGAGLGGGSADGAFTLQLLNQEFHLQLSASQLLDYALQLGSDCPFFIINKPAFAQGRGEMLQTIPLNLSGYSIVLIHPGIHVSTARAFAGVKPQQPVSSLSELILQPMESWRENIVNDFEETVFEAYPLLNEIKKNLYTSGAIYASMSGSGSAIYGIYETLKMPAEKLYPHYFELHTAM